MFTAKLHKDKCGEELKKEQIKKTKKKRGQKEKMGD